ncbi:hypothetical protein NT6N_05990 [Oceaniferula spumae]|uniref:Very short patch repair endonuclease n=1 Tax=Oceaniferula spumae TaxID=2979115 RepID=A0AAT9FHY3_9BACT
MADIFSKEKRSWVMSQIRGKNTKPERLVRSLLHRQGYRFTINATNNKKLPGKPDIVLPKYHTVIFVHGCFWHGHPDCPSFRIPKTRPDFWQEKITKNRDRDQTAATQLRKAGWNVVTIWECELRNLEKIQTLNRRLPYLIEQKPMEYRFTENTCELPMVAEEEGWYEGDR